MSLGEPAQDLSDSPSLGQTAPKRPVSERKIQANRQNALRSTGPTTARGKRNVSRNAIKHGILAREVVITAGDGEESLKAVSYTHLDVYKRQARGRSNSARSKMGSPGG